MPDDDFANLHDWGEVGVVGDVRDAGLDSPTVPEIYFLSALIPWNPLSFVVRSKLPAKTLVPQIRSAIQSVDSSQPIHDIQTMSQIAGESVALKRVKNPLIFPRNK